MEIFTLFRVIGKGIHDQGQHGGMAEANVLRFFTN